MQKINKKLKTRLLIIRHGETDSNVAGKVDGQIETKLTKKGIKQAKELSKQIKLENVDIVYSSPLKRAHETAKIALENYSKIKINLEPKLKEINCGTCSLMKREDIIKKYPKLVEGWKDLSDPPFPDGESLRDVQKRVMPFIYTIIKKHKGKTILISSHGAVNRAIIGAILKIPAGLSWKLDQSNCCINEIVFTDDDFIVKKINYISSFGVLKKS